MSIYTRSGDEGRTSLIYGRRIDKDDLRVQVYGTVDEVNSVLGLAGALLPQENFQDLHGIVARLQRDLFDVGRDLATPEDKRDGFFVGQGDVDLLERIIDHLDPTLPPLTRFVLPGGHPAAAAFHQARTVARRAERLLITLQRTETVQPVLRKYLNRLSDVLFVLARAVNARLGLEEPGVDFQAEKIDPLSQGNQTE